MAVWSYPPTRKQVVATVLLFAAGASLFGYGAYLSLANVEPQRARAKARSEFVRERLRKVIGD
ncbi:unnamed protein product [Linum tenue]|nr:unnamed protein product [Linum tenue]